MKKLDPIIIGIIVVTLLVAGGIIFAASRSQSPSAPQYRTNDAERPKLEIAQTSFDFGKMKVSDEKDQEITIRNTGQKPLVIFSLLTSCNCTFAQLTYNGQASPKFSMHDKSNWSVAIAPGDSATMKIFYEPRLMPVQGGVTRDVLFKTNDPANPNGNIKFTAYVE